MGYLSGTFTLTASLTREINSLDVGDNTLLSISLVGLTSGTLPNSNWAEIGVLSDGISEAQRAAVLDFGYVDTVNPLAWSGSMPVEGAARIYAVISGIINNQVRLSALLVPKRSVLVPRGPNA